MNAVTPLGVRQAIVRLHQQGRTYSEVAELLGIGEATVSRILRLHRETGHVAPRARGGGNHSRIRGSVAETLVRLVEGKPDSTSAELAGNLLSTTGVHVSRSAVVRALSRLGYSLKKSPSPRWSAKRRSTSKPVESSPER